MPLNGDIAISKKKKNHVLAPSRSALGLPCSSSSSCSSSSPSLSSMGGLRVACKRRNTRVLLGSIRRGDGHIDALALPLGMSIAAVVAQVVAKKESAADQMSSDHLSMLCTSAVRECITNIYGDKFNCFVGNFEKSFQSTLRTLRMIDESSKYTGRDHSCDFNIENSESSLGYVTNNYQSEKSQGQSSIVEHSDENDVDSMNLELAQIVENSLVVSSTKIGSLGSVLPHFVADTCKKSLIQQTRSNNLKAYKITLQERELHLKEAELALRSHRNIMEKLKLSLGFSKSSFKTEKFKTELEETRYAELLKNCIDCLVASLLIMSAALSYGAYIHSYRRITEATASCTLPEESRTKSWFNPMSSLNSSIHIMRCQIQVVSRMVFGILMILSVAFLILQRSSAIKQQMPITFILLLLGIVCGFAGKLCVDTLGGHGLHWLVYWEILCLFHFFSNVWTSALFSVLYGPIDVCRERKIGGLVALPYWIRRNVVFGSVLVVLPLSCGLLPFGGVGEWKDHFLVVLGGFLK